METSKRLSSTVPPEEYSRRTVRAWWADGLWDLALAGFWILTAVWLYPWVRPVAFPPWTSPWPFITHEQINPSGNEISLWGFALFPIWISYAFLAHFLVERMKRVYVAPRLGDVHLKFLLPLERGFAFLYLATYVLGSFLLGVLFWKLKGGPHFFSFFIISSFAAVLFLLGRRYQIRRYPWIAAIGTAGCVLAELLTTNAVYLNGPKNFLDVSPFYGNPS